MKISSPAPRGISSIALGDPLGYARTVAPADEVQTVDLSGRPAPRLRLIGQTSRGAMSRARAAGIVAVAVVVVGAVASPSSAAVKYGVTDLGTLGGETTFAGQSSSRAYGINVAGHVVGFALAPDKHAHAFLYRDGQMLDLGTLTGPAGGARGFSTAYAVNDRGQVVGFSDTATSAADRAFVYDNGVMTDLGAGRAYGINAGGQIVGESLGRAVAYENGRARDLGTLDGTRSGARAINAAGQVFGSADTTVDFDPEGNPILVPHAALFQNGTVTDLTPAAAGASVGYGVNGGGQVVGYAELTIGSGQAFRYSGGTLTDLGVGTAHGINDAGQIVGIGRGRAFLYEGGTMSDLNTLLPADSGWTLQSAEGINNAGQIVGWGTNPAGQGHAFLLTPVPEPASAMTVLILAGTALASRRSRRRPGRTLAEAAPLFAGPAGGRFRRWR
jgi:probable HAF family extracellular repeat protein